jgi:hypothetical protein
VRSLISSCTKAALAAAKARGQVLGGPRLAEARAISHARLKADAEAHAEAVMPAIREAQAAGGEVAAPDRRRSQWAWDRHGAGRQVGSADRRQHSSPSGDLMVFIAISQAAFDAISATLALGSVSYENKTNEKGERLTWLAPNVVARLRAMRGPDESFSDVIPRIAGETQGGDRL